MEDNVTLSNGLTLGGLFQDKELLIQELREENSRLRTEKAHLAAENQTVLREQAQAIKNLNQQLSLLTCEQTKHFSTVELLESVKIEKEFLVEELQIQYDNDKKQKVRILHLEECVSTLTTENTSLQGQLADESRLLQEERKESHTLSCLVGERDVSIEQCKSEVKRLNIDLETLKHALSSKDTKLKNVLDERNKAQWKLQDIQKSLSTPHSLKKRNSNSYIPVTPPRIPKDVCPTVHNSISPTTITAGLTPDRDVTESEPNATQVQRVREEVSCVSPIISEQGSSFDLKEKHYLSLIYRLRSELARVKEELQDRAVGGGSNCTKSRLKSTFVRQPIKVKRKDELSSWA